MLPWQAFKFTPRTASNFIGAIAPKHTSNISGLSYLLRGADQSIYYYERPSYTVEYIRSVGLIGSSSSDMMADSSDGVLGYSDNSGAHVTSIEVKTMTTPNMIRNAKDIRERFASFSILKNICRREGMDKYFRELVLTTAYWFQCIHHAATPRHI